MEKETLVNLQTLFTVGATEVSLLAAVDAFLVAECGGLSPLTQAWYHKRLYPMAESLGKDRPLASIMETDLIQWYSDLANRQERYVTGNSRPTIQGGLSKDTLHGYVRACRRFFKWIFKKGILAVDVSADLKLPRLPRRGRRGIGDIYAKMILDAAKDNPRDYALVRFLETSGARRAGAAGLLLSDLSLNADDRIRRRVVIREKFDKERPVILTPGAFEALRAWLKVRPAVHDEHVFLGRQPGRDWMPLTVGGISAILRRYKTKLGIQGSCSPHQWRHRWCRVMLQRGMPLALVSQLAGHETVAITAEFYGRFEISKLQESFDRFATEIELPDK